MCRESISFAPLPPSLSSSLNSEREGGRSDGRAARAAPAPGPPYPSHVAKEFWDIKRSWIIFSRGKRDDERRKGKRDEMRRDTRERRRQKRGGKEREGRGGELSFDETEGENIPPCRSFPATTISAASRQSRHLSASSSLSPSVEVKYFFSIMITSVFHFSPASLFPLSLWALPHNRRRRNNPVIITHYDDSGIADGV